MDNIDKTPREAAAKSEAEKLSAMHPAAREIPSLRGKSPEEIDLLIKSGNFNNIGINTYLNSQTPQKTEEKKKQEYRKRAFSEFFSLTATGIGYVLLETAQAAIKTLTHSFAPSASANAHTITSADGSQIVFQDDIAVTLATQIAVAEQQSILSKKFNAFQAIDMDAPEYKPGTKMAAGRELIETMREADMMRHPLRADFFVASIERIEALEAKHQAEGNHDCSGIVCAFRRVAGPQGITSRGLKVDISDVFDDEDPSEIKLTVNEQSAKPAPPASAPGLRPS